MAAFDVLGVLEKYEEVFDIVYYKENIVCLNNNYSNMPSYTKMLRKALYSTSDISSMHSNSNSNGGNNSSSIGNSGHSLTHKNSSDSTKVLEQISEEEHMHEDNQTLLQAYT